ncbi:MAG: hypothetical protein IT184_18745 [Acidobacteria bacterium]|nr:hypothetical protein [Acidobacteriota bacterium]
MMMGLLWAVRILIILLIVRIVLRWFAERQIAATRRTRVSGGERSGGQLVRDPQCGTFVAERLAVKAGGHAFCSTTCRDQWLAAADRTARSS